MLRISLGALGLVAMLTANAASLPNGIAVEAGDTALISIRLARASTPDMRGTCPPAVRLAEQSRDFTAAWLAEHAGSLEIRSEGLDRHGNLLVKIEAGGRDLGTALIEQGLARPGRQPWC